jgi:hypothetical protein
MAISQAQALFIALREVLEKAGGSLRTIPYNTYSGDLPEELSDMEMARRSVCVPRIECTLNTRRSPSQPLTMGNLFLYAVDLNVRVIRTLEREAQIVDETRDMIKALAFEDAPVIAEALGYPGNLLTTSAGDSTGLVSGLFSYLDSTSDIRGSVDEGASIIETNHRFTGTVRTTPAVV